MSKFAYREICYGRFDRMQKPNERRFGLRGAHMSICQDKCIILHGGGGGHLTVYYTSPKSFIITLSYSLAQELW